MRNVKLWVGCVLQKDNIEGAVGRPCWANGLAQRAPHAGIRPDDYCYAVYDSPSVAGAHFDAQSAPLALLGVYLRDIGHGLHCLCSRYFTIWR